ncbi:DUF1574 domain-containing protein [Paenibacillus woosongensis]|uniref:DUF1574 domain-containing protein n=1 Tax=Paenibacillus woosongensis TaxID=307580 RepID=A0ABQ4MSK9_9BACL|nr:DUF1574 domain-containing protein [Paenibacillus woosongensis]GIP58375.1 hypothetical protein J15TS10_21890 [Paenibacillus woosongensis]
MSNLFMNKTVTVMMVSLAIAGLIGISDGASPIVDHMKEDVVTHAKKELRVPAYDSIVYTPLWIEYLNEQPDNGKQTVGIFGPSTVYGTTVMKGANTSAGVMQVHLKDKQVLNFGLTGGRFTETYAVLASIIDKIDYVVYEINYGIAVVSDNESNVTVYPSLITKLDQNIPRSWLNDFPDKNRQSLPSDIHNWATSHFLSNWTLYHDRDVISYKLFKTRTPMEKIRREIKSELDKKNGVTPSYAPMYTAFDKMQDKHKEEIEEHFKKLYTWNKPFNKDDSFGLFMIEKTLDLLQEHNKKAVFYSAPLDKEHLTKKKLLNWDDYNKVMGAYQELIESRGYFYIEFNKGKDNTIPHKFYRDPSHMLDEGNKMFGEILYKKLTQYGITNP